MRCMYCGGLLKMLDDKEVDEKVLLPLKGSGVQYYECTICGSIFRYEFCSVTGRPKGMFPVIPFARALGDSYGKKNRSCK